MYQKPITTSTLGTSALKAAATRYYKELDGRASKGKLRIGAETSVSYLLIDTYHHTDLGEIRIFKNVD